MTAPHIAPGARVKDETDEAAAAAHVQTLFNAIAPTYDRANHLISMGLDRHWWRKAACAFRSTLARPDARILDLCCGTGDMTAALLKVRKEAAASVGAAEPLTGLDFSAEMLTRARVKYPSPDVLWVEGDAMHLPYPDATFDLVTAAFGFRNLTDYAGGLREIFRVLRPGGRIGILEANQPEGLSAIVYNAYFRGLVPLVGGMISGDRAAYKYLPASVARFPRPPNMLAMMRETGFADAAWDGYLLHAAGLYRGTK